MRREDVTEILKIFYNLRILDGATARVMYSRQGGRVLYNYKFLLSALMLYAKKYLRDGIRTNSFFLIDLANVVSVIILIKSKGRMVCYNSGQNILSDGNTIGDPNAYN